jgi:hypothetical protein
MKTHVLKNLENPVCRIDHARVELALWYAACGRQSYTETPNTFRRFWAKG